MGVLHRSIIQRGPSSRRNRDSEVIGNGGRTGEGCAGDATPLRLGADWLDVPEPVATLLRHHMRNRSNMTTAANPASRWLFPGQLSGAKDLEVLPSGQRHWAECCHHVEVPCSPGPRDHPRPVSCHRS